MRKRKEQNLLRVNSVTLKRHTHRDYNGVQLNPLIVSVDTEIIGKDNIYGDKSGTDGVLSLIDVGNTGFPNYLIILTQE